MQHLHEFGLNARVLKPEQEYRLQTTALHSNTSQLPHKSSQVHSNVRAHTNLPLLPYFNRVQCVAAVCSPVSFWYLTPCILVVGDRRFGIYTRQHSRLRKESKNNPLTDIIYPSTSISVRLHLCRCLPSCLFHSLFPYLISEHIFYASQSCHVSCPSDPHSFTQHYRNRS